MASMRSLGLVNTNRLLNENQSKKLQHPTKSLKASGTPAAKFALKDVTNNSQKQAADRINVFKDGASSKAKRSTEKSLNATTTGILQNIAPSTKKPTAGKASTKFSIFTPLDAEYQWGADNCRLRDDLLEQMINCAPVTPSSRPEKRPLPKPTRSDMLDLPELDEPWDYFDQTSKVNLLNAPAQLKPLALPADDFPLVDIQDLEFLF
ncbi:uncharacterized protein LOC118458569 [Anopheles albimanus]|uniref:Uncharacterized protein n=1 Tax=Anopheles albimanus TaxID=7167 RepID=A0A182F0Q2_ANOAL|nr:uncharacterized protein LOC118458569 [Anopheles albimanus]